MTFPGNQLKDTKEKIQIQAQTPANSLQMGSTLARDLNGLLNLHHGGSSAPPPAPLAPPSLAAPPARPPAPLPAAPPPYPAPLPPLDPQVGQVGPAKVDTRRRARQRTKRSF